MTVCAQHNLKMCTSMLLYINPFMAKPKKNGIHNAQTLIFIVFPLWKNYNLIFSMWRGWRTVVAEIKDGKMGKTSYKCEHFWLADL